MLALHSLKTFAGIQRRQTFKCAFKSGGGGGGGREPGRLESGRRERKGWEAGVLRGREAERNVKCKLF